MKKIILVFIVIVNSLSAAVDFDPNDIKEMGNRAKLCKVAAKTEHELAYCKMTELLVTFTKLNIDRKISDYDMLTTAIEYIEITCSIAYTKRIQYPNIIGLVDMHIKEVEKVIPDICYKL